VADVRPALVLGLHRLVQDHPLAVAGLVTPPSDRLVRRVSIAASAGLVLVLAATLGYVAWPRMAAAVGVKPAATPPPYAAGEAIDVPAAWYDRADTTLILFARASCAACDKAKPFLAQLVARVASRGDAVMAHPPGAPADDQAFARGLGFSPDRIVVVDTALKVRATPTVVLVNRQGTILGAWEGVGADDRQAAILKAVDAALR
jgi:hypothetical protein